ncbi:DNA-directed RNA polymerase subunit beta [Aggregicoccus sp. 17bor-14]|uniref:DNA-directed RNA polymerase subunit beta n=1 Tax=Myxococcaceae TaxID=31 RepID=UPI00129C5918|nr:MULTISPECIES: DNA-directed RNA polymerase subunit beta [Myxococcaceae]MBF5041174.1 DNA-directed RNA polymerase subunit beta [Simulacricoccus sp. 17bor-14]MRI86961.1 DNA-directed RNA polymerase subunit beta [Aggregicoccus sp. 17bor-14]
MPTQIQNNFRVRKTFAKIGKIIDIPNLINIQKQSYEKFLQADIAPEKREDLGLQGVFKSVFPIRDFNETSSLEFVSYHLEKPKYDVDECHQRGMTYSAPIKVVVRLVVWDKDEETGAQSIRDVKEQEVYFGEIPLMTQNGTFIINGTERVVVSQLHRSPGAFFDHDKGKSHSSGKLLYNARIIPYRGSWIDFEFDHKDLLYVRIDRRRKLPATVLIRALGAVQDTAKKNPLEFRGSTEEILNYYYATETIYLNSAEDFEKSVELELLPGQRATRDIKTKSGEVIVKKNRKFTRAAIKKLEAAKMKTLPIDADELWTKVSAYDVVDETTGEVILECNEEVSQEKVDELLKRGIKEFKVLFIDNLNVGPYLRETLMLDKIDNPEQAIMEIYRRLRPGDPPTPETAINLFTNLFFNPERYDLSKVGRLKLNFKFGLEEPLDGQILTKRDILEVIRYLIDLKNGRGTIDDIDHLGNRRVRAVGELLENQYRIGLVRMERAIKERMSLQEIETLMPHDLINAKPVTAVIKEFFGSSQLSQFMDQTNPLSEVTHKRRLSALGPGGLTRERAGFEVRDVHPTHYGRICPIETPEGPNIGLIASLSTYARVNEFGFVETPYRKVDAGVVSADVAFYSALEEEKHTIAQANAEMDKKGKFVNELVSSRRGGEFVQARAEDVDLMDVSPNQLVSVAASLIPFLENDDANRALMGSNMQRQAVPLLRTFAPLVGTGIEAIVARDSGVTCVARRDGIVEAVDAGRIVVKADVPAAFSDSTSEVDIYNLLKYQRSNQNTCLNQKPIVRKGDRVKKGDVIADGPATETGELALGQNIVVAFMPWQGYNFEDSILINERILKDDVFTSIHIEEFECIARDTKLGKEEITRDIPNVGEEALKDLDESGIIRIGAEVKPGDVLVGKITPKGETQLSPEEKLLRAIFGEKAGDVRDSSLRVPPGVQGTVISAKVFSRKGVEKDERAKQIESMEEAKLLKDQNDEIKVIRDSAFARIRKMLSGKEVQGKLVDDKGKILLKKGDSLNDELLSTVPYKYWSEISVGDPLDSKIRDILRNLEENTEAVKLAFGEKIARIKKGDELPPGVIKMVKVYVAIKRKLAVGDKMAGRHGNKGVVSRILPEEDMPYLEDGRPVDIVLNPLGVPSRMNIGQILEVHLGWAAKGVGERLQHYMEQNYSTEQLKKALKAAYDDRAFGDFVDGLNDEEVRAVCQKLKRGIHVATPVFDGARETEIHGLFDQATLPRSGQMVLFDGRTGEPFDQNVTVGVMYMLKLHHLVDEKIHARSIGPYSLVTQQPLGGKAQFGGQRLGEMEVWAMEAYGAAYTLQEFLTVKSDDVVGRTRMYEAIVKGDNVLESGLPESFNVLLKELQSLALDVELLENAPPERQRAFGSGLDVGGDGAKTGTDA